MKILLVSKKVSSSGGGTDQQVFNLARILSKKNDVSVLTSNLDREKIPGVKVIRLPVIFKYQYYIVCRGLKVF